MSARLVPADGLGPARPACTASETRELQPTLDLGLPRGSPCSDAAVGGNQTAGRWGGVLRRGAPTGRPPTLLGKRCRSNERGSAGSTNPRCTLGSSAASSLSLIVRTAQRSL